MSKVVVISGHPALQQSNTNKVILAQLQQHVEDVDIRALDSLYPDYQIDIESEQQALIAADVVVLQFPFYWYSMPALLKKWLDDVFSYDFAYGAKGDKLKGKSLILSITIGGPSDSYTPLGYNHFSIDQLLKPLEQTAYLAQMNFQAPECSHGMVYIPGVYNTLEDVQQRAIEHSSRLIQRIQTLQNNPNILIQNFVKDWFEKMDQLPKNPEVFTASLAKSFRQSMPEGEFYGEQGFREWYQMALATFKPQCKHLIENVEIEKLGERYQVKLRIRLIAQTYPESAMQGEDINMLVNETWSLAVTQGQIELFEYKVELTDS